MSRRDLLLDEGIDPLICLLGNAVLLDLPPRVDLAQLCRQLLSTLRCIGKQQLHRLIGVRDASRGVDAGGDTVADKTRMDPAAGLPAAHGGLGGIPGDGIQQGGKTATVGTVEQG